MQHATSGISPALQLVNTPEQPRLNNDTDKLHVNILQKQQSVTLNSEKNYQFVNIKAELRYLYLFWVNMVFLQHLLLIKYTK